MADIGSEVSNVVQSGAKSLLARLMDSTDPTAQLHTLMFLLFGCFVIVALATWGIFNLMHHIEMALWSSTLRDTFITAGGAHVLNSAFGDNKAQ